MAPADTPTHPHFDRVRFAPPAEWVISRELDETWLPPVHTGSSLVLLDCQHHATRHECYRRSALRMDTMAGVQHAAQWRCDFDPATQRVTIHSLLVRRGTETAEHATPERLRVFQREQNLDRLALDGTVTLLILLEDVRVCDIVDASYTIETSARIFPDQFGFLTTVPIERYARAFHLSVRFRKDQPLRWYTDSQKLPLTERALADNEIEWSWCIENFSPRPPEQDMPPWHFQGRFIQVSDFKSWQEVASGLASAWTEEFENPVLTAAAVEIATLPGSLEERAECALRLVQDDLRYLSVNTELGGQIPTAPGKVLQRRFGDCKDKAFLLVHLLRRLGIPARAVLVHSRFRRRIEQFLPTPDIFDHVIVEFELGGKRSWVDATIPQQGGGPLGRALTNFELGLPVDSAVIELEPIFPPNRAAGRYELTETLRLKSSSAPIRLKAVVRATGSHADELRRRIAFEGATALSQGREQLYRSLYASVTPDTELEWKDDRNRNELVTADSYAISKSVVHLAEPGVCGTHVVAHVIRGVMIFNDTEKRKQPLAVPYPCSVRHSIVCDFETIYGPGTNLLSVETKEFRFELQFKRKHGRVSFDYNYQTYVDHVAAKDYTHYRAKVHEAWKSTQLAINFASDRRLGKGDHSDAPLLPDLTSIEETSGFATDPALDGGLTEIAPCLSSMSAAQREAASSEAKKKPSRATFVSFSTDQDLSRASAETRKMINIISCVIFGAFFIIKLIIALLAHRK